MSDIINKRQARATSNTWVVVLAAGDGRRLHHLTKNESGVPVPKQFCSLSGGQSLLRSALQRAEAVASPRRICTVVAEQHRRWWEPALVTLAPANVIVQPRNRGTANGILLPLLHILRRDPGARVVLLPSDHYVEHEEVLAGALRGTVRRLGGASSDVMLLGISPDEADPDLGYIVPGARIARNLSTVARFVEKPHGSHAQELISAGALWNAFIVAAHASTLLNLFNTGFPWIVKAMQLAVERDQSMPTDPVATADLYKQLAEVDFSKQVLEGAEDRLRVVPVPSCGWNDLGTPMRLAETLRRLAHREPAGVPENDMSGFLNLSQQHARLGSGDASAGR